MFIHIPKTGGSSIENHFLRAGWKIDFWDRWTDPHPISRVLRCSPQHFHCEMLEIMMNMDRFDLVFTVVRHPIERILSEYAFREGNRPIRTSPDTWIDTILDRFPADPYVLDNHIRPQKAFVPKEGCRIHRFETGIDAVLCDLSQQVGEELAPEGVLRVNASRHRSNEAALAPSMRERLRAFYAADFDAFGYS